MNIYEVTRERPSSFVDEMFKFIVIAPTERDARLLASNGCRDEGADIWFDKNLSICTLLGKADKTQDDTCIVAEITSHNN